MTQTKLTNNIVWENINFYEEVQKIMYPDGFDKIKNHGLWKLKIKLTYEEWTSVKHLFHYYTTTKNIKNMTHLGWATVKPVEVMKKIYEMRNN